MSLFDSALRSAQAAINGGMRTASTMQRPSDNAANARARKRRRNRNGGGSNQLSAQDLIALWQSMPTPNRGFRRPGGDQPDFLGGGLDQFYAKNPGIARGADRAGQIAAERKQQLSRGFEDGRAAVDFVKQTKGYTDAQGNFVPPTMPTAPSSNYGTGSVAFTDKPTDGMMTDPLTGQSVRMDQYLPQQDAVSGTKSGPMTNDITDPVTGAVKSYNDAGIDYFNPQKAQMPSAIPAPQPAAPQSAGIFDLMRQAKATAPQNDMTALFPGAAPKPISGGGGGIAPVDWMGGMEPQPQKPFQMPQMVSIPEPKIPFGTDMPQYEAPAQPEIADFGNQAIPQNPYGVNGYGVPLVRGDLPLVGMAATTMAGGVADWWAGLMGQPQTAGANVKRIYGQQAREQYRQGIR